MLNLGSNVELSQSRKIPFQSSANKCHHTMSALAAEFSNQGEILWTALHTDVLEMIFLDGPPLLQTEGVWSSSVNLFWWFYRGNSETILV